MKLKKIISIVIIYNYGFCRRNLSSLRVDEITKSEKCVKKHDEQKKEFI